MDGRRFSDLIRKANFILRSVVHIAFMPKTMQNAFKAAH